MMTFSLRPTSRSDRLLMAASVRTRVVSWKEAAESHESVASEALVMPMRTGRAEAGEPPSVSTRRFSAVSSARSTRAPGRNSVLLDSLIATRRIIWRTMTSMCLSWIDTPCER